MAFSEFNRPVSLRRPYLGQYVNGVWVPSPNQDIVVQSSVQPSPGSDMQLLPEGRRMLATYTLYSTDEIREQDQVQLFGAWYEVLRVARWQNGILPHYKAIAQKMQQEGTT